MRTSIRMFGLSAGVAVALAAPAAAQTPRDPTGVTAPRSNNDTATVLTSAPVFLLPDSSREPLRVASAGSVLRVVGQSDGWYNVQFQDPQFGLRTGFIEARNVRVQRRALEPIDLSVVSETEPVQPAPRTSRQPSPPSRPGSSFPAPSRPQGVWFNVGLGYGSGGCTDCLLRYGGASGGLVVGGRISDRWLFGVGTTGWRWTNAFGDAVTVGTFDARFRFYPGRTSGFFATMGLGLGTISDALSTEVGVGTVLGLGWDIRVGRKVSLTPFWNGFAVQTSNDDANVGQLGLGITVH